MMRFFIFIVLLFTLVPSVAAATFRSGDTVTFSAAEESNGALFISGSQVRIEGSVKGDLFCAGQDVDIIGTVEGDVLCAGQTVRIHGPVAGDVRVAGQMVSLKNSVAKNASLLGQTLYLEPQASVSGELGFLSQTFRMEGSIGSSVFGMGETAIIAGMVGKDATLYADRVQLSSTGNIQGNLTYTSQGAAELASGSVVQGRTSRQKPEQQATNAPRFQINRTELGFRGFSFIMSSVLFGGLLLFFFKNPTEQILSYMKQEVGGSLLRGLLVLIVVPIALVILFVTIIGIPLALVGIVIFALLYFIARSFTAIVIGSLLLEQLWEKQKDARVLGLGLGVLVLWSVSFIPVIGGITSLLSLLYGVGGITSLVLRKQSKRK